MAQGQGGYVPTFGELVTTPVNPDLGTGGPGVALGRNEGIHDILEAATFQAQMNWAKHKEIEDRKAKYFENLKDLSQLPTMAEDRGLLREKMGNILKKMLDPNVFNGRDAQATADLQNDIVSYGEMAGRSKQDLANYEFDKKIKAEHPEEYENQHNNKSLEDFRTGKLGERTYKPMVPRPKFDYDLTAKAALAGTEIPLAPQLVPGRYEKDKTTGQMVFTPNADNPTFEQVTTGGIDIDRKKFRDQLTGLLSNEIASPMVKADLQFKFEEMTPEQQKELSVDGDGKTPDFDKMIGQVVESKVLQAQGTPGTTTIQASRFGEEMRGYAQQEKLTRMQIKANEDNSIRAAKAAMDAAGAKNYSKDDLSKMATIGDNFTNGVVNKVNSNGEQVTYNGKVVKGMPVNKLSAHEKQTLGLSTTYQGVTTDTYADQDIMMIPTANGFDLVEVEEDDGKWVQKEVDKPGWGTGNTTKGSVKGSLTVENIRESALNSIVKGSSGKEWMAYLPQEPATGGKQPDAGGLRKKYNY